MEGYCTSWPAPLKEAWTKCNRLDHKYRLLEANFVKIDFSEFDEFMAKIERVQQSLFEARMEFEALYRHYYPGMPGMSGCP